MGFITLYNTKYPCGLSLIHKIIQVNNPKQKILYLMPINQSPTDPAVVYETMRQNIQIARKCQQDHMQVT